MNLQEIGNEAEQSIYLTRIALLLPALREKFNNLSIVESIIDSLLTKSNLDGLPLYRYLIHAIDKIGSSNDTNNIQINYLNQKQQDFILENLEGFKEILRYLIIGNRRIEKLISDDLYNSAETNCLFVFNEYYEGISTLTATDPNIHSSEILI